MASSPGDRLGRDHPRLGIEANAVERTDDVVKVPRGHLVPPVALHPETGQQCDQRRIAEFGGRLKLLDSDHDTLLYEIKAAGSHSR